MTKKPKTHKQQKISNSPPPLTLPLSLALSSLPNEVVVSILARISKSYYSSLCLVSKSFYSLLSSPDIYTARTEIGATETRLYLYVWLNRPERNHLYTVGGELGLTHVSFSSSYAQLNSTYVSVGSEIYQIGCGNLSRTVRVFDCRSHTWRLAPRLTVPRKNARSCFLDGKIYVIGGREDESMIWGEVFDIKTQIWKPLPIPVDDNSIDLNLQVVVLEGRLNLITKKNKYVYDSKQGRWLRDVLFVGIEVMNRDYCIIDNIIFTEIDDQYKWYNSRYGVWLEVKNLDIVYKKRDSNRFRKTVQLVNHGGKLVITWHTFLRNPNVPSIWCAVIKLEKRLTPSGTHIWDIWGEVERCSALLEVPKSYNYCSCLSVSL